MNIERKKLASNLTRLKVGESFFVECLPKDLAHVRRLAYKLNIKLSMVRVDVDPIYGTLGTRISRVK